MNDANENQSLEKSNLRVLHLDDNIFDRERVIAQLAGAEGSPCFDVESFAGADEFKARLLLLPTPQIVLLDIRLGSRGNAGLLLVQDVRTRIPDAVIVMHSGLEGVDAICESRAVGADDFISKRSEDGELALQLRKAYELGRQHQAAELTRTARTSALAVGETFQQISERVPRILNSAITAVHVQGESGTGKEVVANLFAAQLSGNVPFLRVNCAAIAPNLLESELFGHARGAFTGASSDKKGLIEAANGGWIFLDEVGELTPSAQAALLRALENKEIIPVGSHVARRVDVRVISATNRLVANMIEEGSFRQDLWQRLCEVEIKIPPLRERKDEIPALVNHFCQTMHGGPYSVTLAAMRVLLNVPWNSGNVRELRNCLRAMTEKHMSGTLSPQTIPQRIIDQARTGGTDVPAAATAKHQKSKHQITITWHENEAVNFDILADKLLLELARRDLAEQGSKTSIRSLAKAINVPRARLTAKLQGMIDKKIAGAEELIRLLGREHAKI